MKTPDDLRKFDDWVLEQMAVHPVLFDVVVVGGFTLIVIALYFVGMEISRFTGD